MFFRTKPNIPSDVDVLRDWNATLKRENERLRQELALFKAGADGACIPGKHCFYCAHALGSGSIVRTFTDDKAGADWVFDGPICSKMLPCKNFERKQAGAKPTTDPAKEG